jgi:4-amino-4-deoxy-L-arabinose transferase-like glycosyltransferase
VRYFRTTWPLIVIGVAVALRFWHLGLVAWQYDEVTYHLIASNLITHQGLTEKATYKTPDQSWLYQPPWYPYLLAGWYKLTSPTIYAARALGVLFAAGTLVMTWLLVRHLWGRDAALYALVPVAFDGWLLYIQRVSYIENLVLLVIVLGFWLYARALAAPSWQGFVYAGVAFGAAACLKYTGVYVALAAALCWLIVRRDHWQHMAMIATVLAVFVVDQLILIVWWGNAYLDETGIQIQRVLGLQSSSGSLNSPGALIHLLFAQYKIFAPSFIIGVAGVVIVISYLLRCYKKRNWSPVQHQAILFSWALAGMLTFGLSSLRQPQYFALILMPLYLLVWTELWNRDWKSWLTFGLSGAAVVFGILALVVSTHGQQRNPLQEVQQYAQQHIPRSAIVVADEQVGDLIPQRYCREQQSAACLHHASYIITWNTYLQQTAKLADASYREIDVGARPVWSATGFNGTVTVWKLNSALAAVAAEPILGIDIQVDHDYPVATAAADGRRLIRYVHGTLHATSIGLDWDYCQADDSSDIVGSCAETLSPQDALAIADEARSAGLSVQFRPLIRVGPVSVWDDPTVSWEGRIYPSDQPAWFANLLAADRPYLRILRSIPGSQFVVGTELDHMAQAPGWPRFIARARAICRCSVSLDTFDHQYARDVLPPESALGVDWYPDLHIGPDASQQRVTAALEASLAVDSPSVLERTMLDEESIRATAGAYDHPQNWNAGGRAAPQVQARYFTAVCQAVEHYHMQGTYFYMIPLNDNPADPTQFPAYFVGNAGTTAIQGCAALFNGSA